MYIYTYIHVYIYIYTYIHTHTYISMCVYTYYIGVEVGFSVIATPTHPRARLQLIKAPNAGT